MRFNLKNPNSQPSTISASANAKRRAVLTTVVPVGVVLLLLVLVGWWRISTTSQPETIDPSLVQPVNQISLERLLNLSDPDLQINEQNKLLVNGELTANDALVITPGEEPTNPKSGQLYYDGSDREFRYFDGEEFVTVNSNINEDEVCFIGADCGFLTASDIPETTLPQPLDVVDTPTFLNLNLTQNLRVQDGGTGRSSFINNAVLLGNGTAGIASTNAPTPGQVLVANSSGTPRFVNINGDATVNSSGSLSLSANTVNAAELASTGVAAGVYGNGSEYPVVTVDEDGRITAVSTQSLGAGGSVTSLNSLAGALNIQGTVGEISVSDNGTDTITLSLGANVTQLGSTIELGTETTGTYDATPDTIADDGVIDDSEVSDAITISASGNVADGALSANVTLQGNTFNGANQLVQLNGSSQLPAVSGALLTNLNASNISSGTLADARLSANVTLLGNSIQDGEVDDNLTVSAAGSVADGALSANVSLLGATIELGTETTGTYDSTPDTIGDDNTIVSSEITDGTIQGADVGNDQIALGTKTTGNYVATLGATAGGGLSITNGTGESSATTAGLITCANGQILKYNAGSWGCDSDAGSGASGVDSLEGLNGALNLLGTANQITVSDNGSDTITLSLPQDINTTSSPTFGGLTINGTMLANGNVTLGDAGTDTLTLNATLQGGSPFVFEGATIDGNEMTFAITDPTADQTITFPDDTGTVCLTTGNCLGGAGGGAPSDAQYLTLALDANLTSERLLQGGSGIDIADGGANGNATLSLNALTSNWNQTGAFDIILNNAGSELTILESAGATFSATLDAGDLTANRTFTLGDNGGEICTDAGNCVGGGAGGAAPNDATYLTLSLDADLTSERSLVAGSALGLTDGGVNANATLAVNTDSTTIGVNGSDQLYVLDGGIDTTQLADSAVTSAKINDGTIQGADVGNDQIALGTKTTGNYVATLGATAGGGLSITNGTGESSATTAGLITCANGQILKYNAGSWGCDSDAGSGASGVDSLEGLNGALNLLGTANQITVSDNGSDTITLSLPQDINTTSSPTFGGLTINGTMLANGNVTLGDAGTDTLTLNATLQGGSPFVFEGATIDGNEMTFAITDPTADQTITFPDDTGTVCLTTGNCLGGAGGGAPSDAQYLTLALDANLTSERLLQGGSGIDIADGGANGNATLSLNALTSNWNQTGAFDIILNNAGSELTILESAGATFSATLDAGDLTANRTFTLGDNGGEICTDAGNCVGGGAGGAAPNDATYLTLSLDADLTSERSLVAGSALGLTDGGVNANATLAVNTDSTTIGVNGSDQLYVLDGGIDTTQLADSAVTSAKINDGTIQGADVGNDQIALGTKTTGNYVATLGATAGGGLSITNGTGESSATTAGLITCANGQILKYNAGSWGCDSDAGSGASGVDSLEGLNGALNLLGTANQITVSDNGSDTITLSLPQDINTTSSPTFGGLTINGTMLANGNVTLGDAGTDTLTLNATLQGGSPFVFEGATIDGNEMTFAITDPTADQTITFPDDTGTVCLTTGNCLGGAGGGAPSDAQYLTLALDANLTSERLLQGGSGIDIADGGANGNATLSLNALTSNWNQTGAFDIILNNAGSELTILESAGATFSATLDAGDLTANRTFTLGDNGGEICTDAGNCVGGGAGGAAPNDATYLTLSLDADLTSERSLVAGSALGLTDGGVNANATLAVNTDSTTIGVNGSDQLYVLDGGIDTTQLADSAVTSAKINDGTIQGADVGNDQIALGTKTTGNYVATLGATAGGGLSITNGTGESSATTAGLITCANGQILKYNAGSWGCDSDAGSGASGVDSLEGLNGALNLLGTANQITVSDNGSDTITLSLPQDINTTSSPTFGGLTINGTMLANGNVTLGDAGTDTLTLNATLQGGSPFVFEGATIDGNEMTFAITDPTADQTITFPDDTGTVCLTTGNCLGGAGGGAPSDAQYLTLALDANLTSERLLQGGSGIDIADGGANGNATLSLNALTSNWNQTGAFDIILNNAGSELTILESAGATFSATLDAGDLTANRTFTLGDNGGEICTDAGNCVGGGAGGAAPNDATYLTLSLDADLTSERSLVAGSALGLTDGGVNANATLAVNTDSTTIGVNGSDQLYVLDGGIDTTQLADSAVTSAKINDGTIQGADVGNDQIALGTKTTGNYVATLGATAGGGLSITNGTGESSATTAGLITCANGQILKYNAGSWGCDSDAGSGASGVDSLEGLNGALNLLGTANQITVSDNGSDTITLSLPQDINTTSSPTFGGLTINGTMLANGNVTLGDAGTDTLTLNATLQGGSPFVFEGATIDGNEMTFAITDPTADQTITFPDDTGTVCLTTGNCLGGAGGGAPSDAQYLTLALDANLTSERLLQGGSGIDIADGGANGNATLSLNALTSNWNQTGAFDIILNNAGSELTILESAGATFSATLDAGDLTANRTFTLGDNGGEICTDAGNCVGGGAGGAAPNDATYLTLSLDADLTSERSLVAGSALGLTDGGVNANATLAVNTDSTTIGVNGSDQLYVLDGGIDTTQLADSAVTSAKINDGTITEPDLSITNGEVGGYVLSSDGAGGFTWVQDNTGTDTTYTAGNDLDLSGTTFNLESQLDFVNTIAQDSSNLTLQTTTSGNIALNAAGTIELQSNSNVTGTLTASGLTTLNGGLTIEAGDTLTFNGDAFTDLTGNGLQETGNALTLNLQANKGLEVDGSGLSLVDCGLNEILKYNGSNQWACATDGGGDGVGVTTIGAIDTQTKSADGAVISGSDIFFQTADASNPGLVSTTAQTFAGNKTFQDNVIVQGNTTLGNAAGDSLTVNATSTFNEDITVAADKSLTLTGGTTANRPSSPSEGEIFYDTDTDTLLTYANGKWQADRGEYTIVAASDSSQAEQDSADYVANGTDDEDTINTALTAASGGKVLLLAGTYQVDINSSAAGNGIEIPNNTTLAGVGSGTVIELQDIDVSINVITNSDQTTGTGVVIRDLSIDGQDDLNTVGTQNGIYFSNMGGGSGASARQGAKLKNLYAYDFRFYGFNLSSSSNNTLTANTAQGNSTGFYLSSSSNYNTLAGNISQGNTYGFHLDASSNNIITSNIAQGNDVSGYGFYLDTSSNNNTLVGNTQSNSNFGIALVNNSNNNTVASNNIHDNGGTNNNNGISTSNADSNTITGNSITDTSATSDNYAINIFDSTSDNNYLADNTLGTGTISDAGTNTIYAGQVDSAGNYEIQPSGNVELLSRTDVLSGDLRVGEASTTDGSIVFNRAANANTVTLGVADQTVGSATITIPDVAGVNDTVCLATLGNCSGAGGLQGTYNIGNTIVTSDARDIDFTLADTTTDASFTVDIATGSTGRFAVQGNGTDVLGVTATAVTVDQALTVNSNATVNGDLLVQSTTDSVTAVQILDQDGGNPIVNVDTINERVGVGTAAPDSKLTVINSSITQNALRVRSTVSDKTDSYASVTGSTGDDRFFGVYTTSDGGLVATGMTNSYGAGGFDMLFVKFDSVGNREFTKTVGGTGTEIGYDVAETPDGGFVVTGETNSFGAGGYDLFFTKFDVNGVEQWTSTIGDTGQDKAFGLVVLTDGSILGAGYTDGFSLGSRSLILTKLNDSGVEQWTKTVNVGSSDNGTGLDATSDGGFVMTSYVNGVGAGAFDMLITKFNSSGVEQWSSTIGGGGNELAYAVRETSDNGIVSVAETTSYGAGGTDMLITKLNSSGVEQWTKTLGGGSGDVPYGMEALSSGNIAVVGRTDSYGEGNNDVIVSMFNSNGVEQWTKTLGGTSDDQGYAAIETPDGGIAVSGFVNGFGTGRDAVIIKFDETGDIANCTTECNDITVTESDVTLTEGAQTLTEADQTVTEGSETVTEENHAATDSDIAEYDIVSGSGTTASDIITVNSLGDTLFQGTNVGIGDTTPKYLFTVGSGDLFGVNNSGNVILNALGSASTDEVVCRNSANQLATCNSTFVTNSSLSLQNTYNAGNTIVTSDARDIDFTLADTATDASFTVDIATGSTGRFAVQGNGTDVLGVTATAVTVDQALTVNATSTFNEDITVAANKSLTLTGGTTANRPASPSEGEIFFDTDTDTLLTYANGKWQAARGEYTIVAASDSAQAEQDAADYLANGTDDEDTINTALTAASGGKVLLLAGTYQVDINSSAAGNGIEVPNNTTLAGVGPGTVIELQDIDVAIDVITNSDQTTGTNVVIRDLVIDGQDDLNLAGAQHGISFNNMGSTASSITGGEIHGVEIIDFRTRGILLSSSDENIITNSSFKGNNLTGVSVSNSINNVVANNTFNSNTTGLLVSGTDNVVEGNTASNNTTGFDIASGAHRTTVVGNTANSNTSAGFIVDSTYNVVAGNVASGNTTWGFSLDLMDYSTVTGNVVEGSSYGMYFDNSLENQITSNYIEGSANYGMRFVNNSNDNLIANNILKDNDGTTDNNAIHLSNSDNNAITDNKITDSSATTTNYAINISDVGSQNNYLAGNTFDSGASINDAGTNTIFAGQVDSAGNYEIQPSGNVELLSRTDVLSGDLRVGEASTTDGLIVFNRAANANTVTLAVTDQTVGSATITIPDVASVNDTVCLATLGNCAEDGTTITVAASDSSAAQQAAADYTADGTADEVEINNAIGDLPAVGGTVVLLPGTFTTAATIQLPDNTTLVGSDSGTTITVGNTATGFNLIENDDQVGGNNNLTIRNLTIDGNEDGGASSIRAIEMDTVGSGSGTTAVTGFIVDNVDLIDVPGDAVYGTDSPNSRVTNSTMINVDGNAVELIRSDYAFVTNNRASNTASDAILINETDFSTISNNVIDGTVGPADSGIRLEDDADNNTVGDNVILNVDGVGIFVKGSGSPGSSDRNTIVGNTIENSVLAGIQIDFSFNNLLSDNLLHDNDTYVAGTTASIELTNSNGDRNRIVDNYIEDSSDGSHAIAITNSGLDDTYIAGNSFQDTAGISDSGTGTVYGGQVDNSGNFELQPQGSLELLSQTNVLQGTLSIGEGSTTDGQLIFNRAADANNITLSVANQTVGSATITIPDVAGVDDTICLSNLNNCTDDGTTITVAADNSSAAQKAAADYIANGEIGDGTTTLDGDQVEINNALTAAAGGKVILLPGTFVIDASISIPNNTTLEGSGRGTIVEFADIDTGDNLIENTDTVNGTGIVVRDMTVGGRDDLNTGLQNGVTLDGLSLTDNNPGLIENLYLDDFSGNAVNILNSDNIVITSNVFQDNEIGITDTSTDGLIITDNVFLNGDGPDIDLVGDRNTVSGNVTRDNTGISIRFNSGSEQNTIVGNVIYDSNSTGIYATGHNSIINANRIENVGAANDTDGIYVVGDDNQITGNYITDTAGAGNAIEITASADSTYLADNSYSGIGASSILDNGTNTIYGGQVDNSGNYELQPQGSIELLSQTNVLQGTLSIGEGSTTDGQLIFNRSADANNITLSVANQTVGSATITIPDVAGVDDTVCLANLGNCTDDGTTITVAANDSTQAEKDAADYVADGTDDHVQINNALTDAAGGKVLLLAGTFTTNAAITIPNDTVLSGVGDGAVITVTNTSTGFDIINNSDTSTGTNVVVRDLKIDGNQDGGATAGDAIEFVGLGSGSPTVGNVVFGGLIENVTIEDNNGYGIQIDDSAHVAVNNVRINEIASSGIDLGSTTTQYFITISNSRIYDVNGNGLRANDSEKLQITDNVIENTNSRGINIINGGDSVVARNEIENTATEGIRFSQANNSRVTDNFIKDTGTNNSGTSAIGMWGINNTIIAGNTIENSGGSAAVPSVWLGNDSNNNTIVDNLFDEPDEATDATYAIEINDANSENNYIADNSVTSAVYSSGIINDSGTNTVIASQIDATSGGALEFNGADVFIDDRLGFGVDAQTIADNASGGTPATLTLDPASSYVDVTCNDPDGCDITMGETNAADGDIVYIINSSTNAITINDTAGVSELAGGGYNGGQYDSLSLIYGTDRWIELSRSDN